MVVSRMPEARTFSFTVYLTRAPDLQGQWVGHCLDVDVVSQGGSLKQAYEMIREAVDMVVLDDLNAGRDPSKRSAPREEWEAAYAEVRSAAPKLLTISELFERQDSLRFAMAPLVLTFVKQECRRPAELQELKTRPFVQAA